MLNRRGLLKLGLKALALVGVTVAAPSVAVAALKKAEPVTKELTGPGDEHAKFERYTRTPNGKDLDTFDPGSGTLQETNPSNIVEIFWTRKGKDRILNIASDNKIYRYLEEDSSPPYDLKFIDVL